jgi:hypothetical protein
MDQAGLTARVAQTNPQVLRNRAAELARLAKLARDPVITAELELLAAQNMARAEGHPQQSR